MTRELADAIRRSIASARKAVGRAGPEPAGPAEEEEEEEEEEELAAAERPPEAPQTLEIERG